MIWTNKKLITSYQFNCRSDSHNFKIKNITNIYGFFRKGNRKSFTTWSLGMFMFYDAHITKDSPK